MFVTGLTYQNIIDREPALADFDTSYATSFTGLIAESKAVIDNRLRALGYDLDKIGKKTDVWDWDNESAALTMTKTLTDLSSTQLLLILMASESYVSTLNIYDRNSHAIIIQGESITVSTQPISVLIPFLDIVQTSISLQSNEGFSASVLKAYLTDPAIYFVHLFKSLEIIYESMRSNPGDLFEQKSLYYGDLYEREFQNLVTFYDADGDGVASLGEQISLNRTTLSR